ncbi:MAG: PAS domain S-box protein, partial [Curvibacter sp.]|nr:PAS domain S-box protein [Curvibacter sp.]
MQENPSRPSRPLAAPAHWLARLKVSSLSAGILLAMTLGLVLPAIIGALMLSEFRRQQLDVERQHYLNDKMEVMARVLAEPLWNFDMDAVQTIGDTVMLDPEVTAFQVTDPQSKAFLQLNDPSRHLGQSTRLVREIVRQGETLGLVQLEIDDGLRQSSLNRDRRFFLALLGGQFLLGLLLVYLSLRRRVLHPLERLTAFSSELAQGHLDTPITLESLDEIGQLARQLDRMRSDLNASFAEKSAILDNIRVGVVFVRQRRIVLANHAADLIFGTQPGGLLGRSTQDIYLSEQQSEQVATAAYRQIAEPGGFFEAELQLRRQDGGEFWALMRGSALNPRAVQDGSVWIFEDITARRQASEQLRLSATVFENTADAVVITDAHHAIVAVNRSFSRITGYGFADVAGQTLELLRSERSDPELYPRMRRTLDHQHFWEGEIWARKQSGEPFIATLTMTAVLDEDLSINHYVGVCQDVTDKKATEREIRFLASHDT